ncbi:progesterone binding protein [Aspergillus luchuensis]|uniref:Progesterone binding protein n=1 Tax=Aspergillus kawachii TaxID=1069201 RepID=A0A146FG98_ASPKA|nr:progesterone binding protein [Aspergillus luchuensis]
MLLHPLCKLMESLHLLEMKETGKCASMNPKLLAHRQDLGGFFVKSSGQIDRNHLAYWICVGYEAKCEATSPGTPWSVQIKKIVVLCPAEPLTTEEGQIQAPRGKNPTRARSLRVANG